MFSMRSDQHKLKIKLHTNFVDIKKIIFFL